MEGDEDGVMEVLGPKIDLVLSKLSNMAAKMEELNVAVKGLQSKVMSIEIEVVSVKTKQIALDNNTVFVDEQVQELKAKTYKNSNDVSNTHRKLLYLEAYSQRENLQFEVSPKLS